MVYRVLYWRRSMIKTILWDFDGVILDSMKIKGDGFVELFSNYDKSYTDLLYTYHFNNGGVSRFDKIRYFFEIILEKSVTDDEIEEYAEKFGDIVSKKLVDKNNIIEETLEFIENNYKQYNFHIVSGAEHNELNFLCKELKLREYFISIDGSPIKKNILIKNVMKKYGYSKKETILIGDALSDKNAAKDNDIRFYGYNNTELADSPYIDSFKGFVLE